MSDFVVYTWDKMDTSIRIIADDIAEYLKDLGHPVETVTKIDGNVMNKKHVISTREHHSPEFMKMFRFVKPKSYVAVHTRNLEEFSDPEWAGFMASFVKGDYAGSPFKGVTYSFYQERQMFDRLRAIFSPSYVRHIWENTVCVPYGIRDEFQPRGNNDKTKWVVPFNRVTNTQKNCKLHSEIVTEANLRCAVKGLPQPTHHFKFADGFGPEEAKSIIDLSPYTLSPQPPTRQQYMDEVGQYGMALSTSLYESFGIYYLELLASGCVVVFLEKPWVKYLLPNYKFMVKKENLVDTLMWVYENYGEAQQYVLNETVPYINQNYRLRRFVNRLAEISNA